MQLIHMMMPFAGTILGFSQKKGTGDQERFSKDLTSLIQIIIFTCFS